jgi:hypothetical protein
MQLFSLEGSRTQSLSVGGENWGEEDWNPVRTTEMEMVASAKGSPMMLSMLMECEDLRPFISIPPVAFLSEGECREP